MKQRFKQLADQVEAEILTGRIKLNGILRERNSCNTSNLLSGWCHIAVERLAELAPDLHVSPLSFRVAYGQRPASNHVVAVVKTRKGSFLVDPTIGQYLPEANLVYRHSDYYPLGAVPGSMRKYRAFR